MIQVQSIKLGSYNTCTRACTILSEIKFVPTQEWSMAQAQVDGLNMPGCWFCRRVNG